MLYTVFIFRFDLQLNLAFADRSNAASAWSIWRTWWRPSGRARRRRAAATPWRTSARTTPPPTSARCTRHETLAGGITIDQEEGRITVVHCPYVFFHREYTYYWFAERDRRRSRNGSLFLRGVIITELVQASDFISCWGCCVFVSIFHHGGDLLIL